MTNNEILKDLALVYQYLVQEPYYTEVRLKENLKELRRLKDVCVVLKSRFDEEER